MNSEVAAQRFRRLYEEHYEALLAYALRRCSDRSEAHDVVADAFLVLWRRLEDAPAREDDVLPWLYGVSRRALANRERTRRRRERLVVRLAELGAQAAANPVEAEENHANAVVVLQGLAKLSEQDREILLLVAWELLSVTQIATVLDCSENAAAIRLHRARKRLSEICRKENSESGHI